MCFLRVSTPQTCSNLFFNETATPEIYTLSLHDALPILDAGASPLLGFVNQVETPLLVFNDEAHHVHDEKVHRRGRAADADEADRKSTRLNSSHANISYAVFCLKKKKQNRYSTRPNTRQH